MSISDTIKYSSTFLWALRKDRIPSEIPPDALLLVRSYMTADLYHIFRSHIDKQKSILSHLFEFLHICLMDFNMNIWKLRAQRWKTWKAEQGITKNDFKHYRQTYINSSSSTNNIITTTCSRRTRTRTVFNYTNPYHDFHNYKNRSFLLIFT